MSHVKILSLLPALMVRMRLGIYEVVSDACMMYKA